MKLAKQGDRVHYCPSHGAKENGIVKEVRGNIVFVVYKCAGEWDNYMNYTGQSTDHNDLRPGWVDENGNLLKQYCDHHYIPSASKWEPIGRMTCIHCNDTID